MALYHPSQLAHLLTGLQEALVRWTYLACEVLAQAKYQQRGSAEQISQGCHRTALAEEQARCDESHVHQMQREAAILDADCDERIAAIEHLLAQAAEIEQQTSFTLSRWRTELQHAADWYERTQERVDHARQAVHSADQECAACQRNVKLAQTALDHCTRNPKRTNCASEQHNVDGAAGVLMRAMELLRTATAELHAAQSELTAAQARVACCQQAVDHAEAAAQIATTAAQICSQAALAVERGKAEAHAAHHQIDLALHIQHRQHAATLAMAQTIQHAQQHVDQAHIALINADQAQTVGQRDARDACYELERRIEQLTMLDRPNLHL